MQNQNSSHFPSAASDAASGNLLWGGVKCNYQSSTYGDNPALAALEKGAAFFVCANPKIFIAMIKNNFIASETYASPTVKVTQINVRRVMCQSPYGYTGNAGKFFYDDEEDPNVHSYEL